MQDPFNADDLLRHNLLFLDFNDDNITLLAHDNHTVRVSWHDFAFHHGDHVDGLYVMVVGAIKFVLSGTHGQCKIIGSFGPGECFGEPFMFPNRPYAADAQAMKDSPLVWTGKRAVGDTLHAHPRLARQMLTGLSTRLHTLIYDTETVNLQNTNERLIGYLLSLSYKFDRTRLPCSKSLVVPKLRLALAMLSRMLQQLIRDELIRVEGCKVVIQDVTTSQRQFMTG